MYSPALSICCEMFSPLSRLAAQTRPAARVGWRQASTGQPGPALVFVEGVRTPFLASLTTFEQMMPHQLLAAAMAGLLQRTGLSPHQVDYLCAGTVQQEVRTSNVTKEAAFLSGFPLSTPGHTVTMACISANQAVTTCMGLLATGQAELCIAGGVEFCSDQPIRYPRLVRQMLMKAPRARSAAAQAEVGRRMLEFGPASLAPEIPDPREFSTAEVMGHSADRLCEVWGVGRQDQDEFGLRSHQLAAAAQEAGLLSDIVPVTVPGLGEPVDRDNGIRPATMEKLAKLKPAFRKGGTVTAANSSFLSDGATACMITTEEKAKQLGLKPKAFLRQYHYASQDPQEELLLGPAYAVPRVLQAAGLSLSDCDVVELHEAFAGQVLSNLAALESEQFCREKLGLQAAVGAVPLERLNLWGGSVSIGHPFGATGIRLLSHAANRLEAEDGSRALVAACAANAQGVAMILERYPA